MDFARGLAVLMGTIIGVGIFGLPFAARQAGFFTSFFYFIILACLVAWVHCIYARIILEGKNSYHLPGYVGYYLGKYWKNIIFIIIFIGMAGSAIAYLIIGGEFLHGLFSSYLGGTPLFYSTLFFILGAILVFYGVEMIANLELVLSFFLLAILGYLCLRAAPHINYSNFSGFSFDSVFIPYGIILFSLWGSNVLPELKEIAGKKYLKKVVVSGVLLSALIYLVFTAVILGVSGLDTSKDAISGLAKYLGPETVSFGFALGVITSFTSFITLLLSFKRTLVFDFKINKNFSWIIACFVPFSIFILGVKRFIPVITFTGAVSLGLESFILIFLYRKFLIVKFQKKLNPGYYVLAAVFALGALFEILSIVW